MRSGPTHEVKGFGLQGELLLHTWHIGESSKDIELAAWKRRMARGEVSRVEVLDLATHHTTTIYA